MTYESVKNQVMLNCRKLELATYTKLYKIELTSTGKMSKIGFML
jgi:hypothetical protein